VLLAGPWAELPHRALQRTQPHAFFV